VRYRKNDYSAPVHGTVAAADLVAKRWYALVVGGGIRGLPAGTYHYDPDVHAVDVLDSVDPRDLVKEILGEQPITPPPVLLGL
jgi:hypothetical protein